MKIALFLVTTLIGFACLSQGKQAIEGTIVSIYTNECSELRLEFKDTKGKVLDLGFSNSLLERDLSKFFKETYDGYVIVNEQTTLFVSNSREIICVSADNVDAGVVVYKVVPTIVDIKSR